MHIERNVMHFVFYLPLKIEQQYSDIENGQGNKHRQHRIANRNQYANLEIMFDQRGWLKWEMLIRSERALSKLPWTNFLRQIWLIAIIRFDATRLGVTRIGATKLWTTRFSDARLCGVIGSFVICDLDLRDVMHENWFHEAVATDILLWNLAVWVFISSTVPGVGMFQHFNNWWYCTYTCYKKS